MATTDIIAFLSLIVALSAYIATIRLRLIDKMKDATVAGDTATRNKLGNFALSLTFADAPLIVSATLLFFHGFWDATLGQVVPGPAPKWLLPWSIYLFAFAGVVLILHHIAAWFKSVFGSTIGRWRR